MSRELDASVSSIKSTTPTKSHKSESGKSTSSYLHFPELAEGPVTIPFIIDKAKKTSFVSQQDNKSKLIKSATLKLNSLKSLLN